MDADAIVYNLKELRRGEQARIVVHSHFKNRTLERLAILGLVPGNIICLKQKKPAYIVQVDQTSLALEPEVCKNIYVKKLQ